MTNELEKTFFDTFGIEPKYKSLSCDGWGRTVKYFTDKKEANKFGIVVSELDYPKITDHILLELICILGNTKYFLITDEGLPIDIDGLKKSVLHSLTLQAKSFKNKELKQQIQALFRENN